MRSCYFVEMKKYYQHNFFKYTYCEFLAVESSFFDDKSPHFKSKSGSLYFYTKDGLYRYSNHWGRVASCRWKIENIEDYKNQQYYVGYAKWADFYPLNDLEKLFYISVDFQTQQAKMNHIKNNDRNDYFLFSAIDAQKRVKQIQRLFKEEKWAKYFTSDINILREEIAQKLIQSSKTLQQIKKQFN